jgi:hypothetical protein
MVCSARLLEVNRQLPLVAVSVTVLLSKSTKTVLSTATPGLTLASVVLILMDPKGPVQPAIPAIVSAKSKLASLRLVVNVTWGRTTLRKKFMRSPNMAFSMNMDKPKWIAGEDYYDAPTCATCHMSATPNQSVTHDVGTRLAWNLRAPVSKRTANWEQKLADMQDVCAACHSSSFVEGFYKQLDSFVALYNDKFAIPAKEIREILMEKEVLSKGNFDDKIDWIYWELWHHEGRRARHGAAMSGPDYAWWHGIYDVAKHFYTELLPETREACEKAGKPEVYEEIIAKYIDGRKEHEWYTKGFDPRKVEEMKAYYKERYQQDVK